MDDALRDACPTRMRPVLMTSLTIILALLPAAIGLGAGAETNAPLSIAVIGGMITSTLLTLSWCRPATRWSRTGASAVARPVPAAPRWCRRPTRPARKNRQMAANHETRSLAVFCDFENVALGVREAKYEKFDMEKVLERLLAKGSIVVKKAYCDWERYKEFKNVMHSASFELIEIPHVRQSGKNSADIRMVVDALDLCYTKAHVDTFVIVSGDSDFSPLVSKLRENAKTVIGVGREELQLRPADQQLRRVHLLRRPGAPRRAEAPRARRSARSPRPTEGG